MFLYFYLSLFLSFSLSLFLSFSLSLFLSFFLPMGTDSWVDSFGHRSISKGIIPS
ncbi:hypothetical protein BP00DRAFT_422921 [Aspergillus indologenus CBS 114.80]|uniref:Uncharacterized protein n=1 Tax=Aspergillus indologenus CBS 114.80 TaxID=1450541 RepID=A0A2V5IKV1_9EURO|nr:hypothetical protein BP00DRAFT_422921 [Aspergillus indologenus CBS 114.80]